MSMVGMCCQILCLERHIKPGSIFLLVGILDVATWWNWSIGGNLENTISHVKYMVSWQIILGTQIHWILAFVHWNIYIPNVAVSTRWDSAINTMLCTVNSHLCPRCKFISLDDFCKCKRYIFWGQNLRNMLYVGYPFLRNLVRYVIISFLTINVN